MNRKHFKHEEKEIIVSACLARANTIDAISSFNQLLAGCCYLLVLYKFRLVSQIIIIII